MTDHSLTLVPKEEYPVWDRKTRKRSGQKTSSRFYGVSLDRSSETPRYRAILKDFNDRTRSLSLGSFPFTDDGEIEAARAIDAYLVSHGELPRNELLMVFERYEDQFFSHYLKKHFSE